MDQPIGNKNSARERTRKIFECRLATLQKSPINDEGFLFMSKTIYEFFFVTQGDIAMRLALVIVLHDHVQSSSVRCCTFFVFLSLLEPASRVLFYFIIFILLLKDVHKVFDIH
jgi:hypothetical protein